MNDARTAAFYQKPFHIVLLALCATALWGAAYPSVKLGYAAFQLDTALTANLFLFAGIRFTLAGLATLLLCCFLRRQLPLPRRADLAGILSLALVQTTGQYLFYYIGMAHTTGVRASILNSASAFLTVVFSAIAWPRRDPMSGKKWLGCLMGLSGVIIVNLGGSVGTQPVTLIGEGAILAAAAFMALGGICSKAFTQGRDGMLITGWQLTLGGLILLCAGAFSGGHLGAVTPVGIALMAFMVFISAVGFTIWTYLLKYNPVSRIAVFSFLTPVFGALLSSLVLSETLFSPLTLLALILVAGGILAVNR